MNDQQDRVANCPHRELAVGWALHALEPAEESLVAAHLPDCPVCTTTAAEAEKACAALGLSLPESIPSAGLEQRVLSVTGTKRTAPVVPEPVVPEPVVASEPSIRPARHISRLSWPRIGELAAAAAVILIAATVILGVRVVQLNGALNQASGQITAMSEAMQRAADPAAIRVPLVTKDGQAVGMVLAGRDRVSVVATRLPGNPADHTYVLWGLADGTPIALAAFDVASETPGLHAVPSATGTGKFTGYAVSLEPGRRSPAVPTDVVASGQVTS